MGSPLDDPFGVSEEENTLPGDVCGFLAPAAGSTWA